MKKIVNIGLLVSVLILTSGVVLAADTAKKSVLPTPIEYTTEQQACIKVAQKERANDVKIAAETLSVATKDALKLKQDAVKSAQKNKNTIARMEEIKIASKAYNSDETVKQAIAPYITAVKSANKKFQSASKACSKGSIGSDVGFFKDVFNKVSTSFLGSLLRIFNFFLAKK